MKNFPDSSFRFLKTILNRICGSTRILAWTDPFYISHRLLYEAVQSRSFYAKGLLLDLGCGNQPYRRLFQHVQRYVAMDVPPSSNVDVWGNALSLPFRTAVFDMVLCNEVIEHVPKPFQMMEEVSRVLKPGGHLLLTAPQVWGLHLEPHDFYRYTKYGLTYLAEINHLKVLEVVPTCGLWATWTQRIVDTVLFVYMHRSSEISRRWVSILLRPVLIAGYLLDRVVGKRGDTLDNILVARKPNDLIN